MAAVERGFYIKDFVKSEYNYFVLGCDVGGTKTIFGVFGVKDEKPVLIFTNKYDSKDINWIVVPMNEILKYAKETFDIEISRVCFACAGVVSENREFVKLTNADLSIDAKNVLEHSLLDSVILLNDFEANAYGINTLDFSDLRDAFEIKHEEHRHSRIDKRNKVIVGAGTGLGKAILVYSDKFNSYMPIASEGGHTDFSPINRFELELLEFIKNKNNIIENISYEMVLSGKGIENIYMFLRKKRKFAQSKYTKEIDKSKDKPALISKYRNLDKTCKETFILFIIFYARCVKNFVLDALALGGAFISGGIAAKNPEMFLCREFIDEFENNHKHKAILHNAPVYVITNENLGLLGATWACVNRQDLAVVKQ